MDADELTAKNAKTAKVGRVTSAVALLWRDTPCAPLYSLAAKKRKNRKRWGERTREPAPQRSTILSTA